MVDTGRYWSFTSPNEGSLLFFMESVIFERYIGAFDEDDTELVRYKQDLKKLHELTKQIAPKLLNSKRGFCKFIQSSLLSLSFPPILKDPER